MAKTILLIACVSKKGKIAAKAKDLYISTLFKSSWKYGMGLKPDKTFILSALYGLLDPERIIEPYNVTLSNVSEKNRSNDLKVLTKTEKNAWGAIVIEQLSQEADMKNDHFIVLAGKEYIKPIQPRIIHLSNPLEGLGLGKRVQFLNDNSL
jgi:cytoplasmic iron level regulating protein YaaA (DUF328/UPF0246 family)